MTSQRMFGGTAPHGGTGFISHGLPTYTSRRQSPPRPRLWRFWPWSNRLLDQDSALAAPWPQFYELWGRQGARAASHWDCQPQRPMDEPERESTGNRGVHWIMEQGRRPGQLEQVLNAAAMPSSDPLADPARPNCDGPCGWLLWPKSDKRLRRALHTLGHTRQG